MVRLYKAVGRWRRAKWGRTGWKRVDWRDDWTQEVGEEGKCGPPGTSLRRSIRA